MEVKDLISRISEDRVKFLSLQFTDVTGSVKSLDIPIAGLKKQLVRVSGLMVLLSRDLPGFRKVICV